MLGGNLRYYGTLHRLLQLAERYAANGAWPVKKNKGPLQFSIVGFVALRLIM
jgi:hypothetical protein